MAIHERVWEQQLRAWKPKGTYTLLGVIAAVFVLQSVVLLTGQVRLFYDAFTINVDWPWRPWSLVTSTLSHGDVMHILFNGMFLFFFGPNVERILGTRRFVTLFLIAGALAGVLQVHIAAAYDLWLLGGDWSQAFVPHADPSAVAGTPALGASGSLMMLFGVLMVLTPNARIMLLFPPIPLKLWWAGVGYAVLDVLGAFSPGGPVANFAHLSGMALGLAYGRWFQKDLRKRGMRITY